MSKSIEERIEHLKTLKDNIMKIDMKTKYPSYSDWYDLEFAYEYRDRVYIEKIQEIIDKLIKELDKQE